MAFYKQILSDTRYLSFTLMTLKINIIALTACLLTAFIANAQKLRYKDPVFEQVEIKQDLNYAADTVKTANLENYRFDLYTPAGDNLKNRPLIIWMHGGGFVFGSKEDRGIKLWSKTFAKRGYVCAAISYRLGKKTNIFSIEKLIKNGYPAVIDARQAVAYFKKHHERYGISADKIILAGNSAGGIMALQVAYSNNGDLAKSLHIEDPASAGSLNDGPTKVAGIINFWGGIYNLEWLKNAHVPIVSVYGSHDRIVKPDYNSGMYGSINLTQRAKELHIPAEVKVFEGYGHELEKHFNPLPIHLGQSGTDQRWLEAGQFAADFIYKYCIK